MAGRADPRAASGGAGGPVAATQWAPAAHKATRTGRRTGIVVAADYTAQGRLTATFAELIGRLESGYTFWETLPPPYGEEIGMTGAQHNDRWIRDLRESGQPVRAVLGFCAGAVFAASIAESIAQWQAEPVPVILFDPEMPDRQSVYEQYTKIISGSLATAMTPEDIEAAREAGRQASSAATSLEDLAVRLGAAFREVCGPAMARTKLLADRSALFVDIFASSQCYLAAATDIDPEPVWSRATVISSTTQERGFNRFTPERRATAAAREIRAGMPHPDLLRSPEVAKAVDELLA